MRCRESRRCRRRGRRRCGRRTPIRGSRARSVGRSGRGAALDCETGDAVELAGGRHGTVREDVEVTVFEKPGMKRQAVGEAVDGEQGVVGGNVLVMAEAHNPAGAGPCADVLDGEKVFCAGLGGEIDRLLEVSRG